VSYRNGYQGAEYAPVRKGVCTKHKTLVEPRSGTCFLCHAKQMYEAGHTGYLERARAFRREAVVA
jgi:hypothetical protein